MPRLIALIALLLLAAPVGAQPPMPAAGALVTPLAAFITVDAPPAAVALRLTRSPSDPGGPAVSVRPVTAGRIEVTFPAGCAAWLGCSRGVLIEALDADGDVIAVASPALLPPTYLPGVTR